MWKKWLIVADVAHQHGAKLALELPANCIYWKWKCVLDFIQKYGLKKAKCNGCALGLRGGVKQHPVYKPWCVATIVDELHASLDARKCPGKAAHPVHAHCRGKLCHESEGYTDEMAKISMVLGSAAVNGALKSIPRLLLKTITRSRAVHHVKPGGPRRIPVASRRQIWPNKTLKRATNQTQLQ